MKWHINLIDWSLTPPKVQLEWRKWCKKTKRPLAFQPDIYSMADFLSDHGVHPKWEYRITSNDSAFAGTDSICDELWDQVKQAVEPEETRWVSRLRSYLKKYRIML